MLQFITTLSVANPIGFKIVIQTLLDAQFTRSHIGSFAQFTVLKFYWLKSRNVILLGKLLLRSSTCIINCYGSINVNGYNRKFWWVMIALFGNDSTVLFIVCAAYRKLLI